MLATVAPRPKDATGWCAELEWEGARGIAYAPQHGGSRLYSRRGNDLSGSFPELREALETGLAPAMPSSTVRSLPSIVTQGRPFNDSRGA